MPELPDIELYLHALRTRVEGHVLDRVRLASPFLLRSVQPPLTEAHGATVTGLSRVGKRIVFHLDDELYLVLHLMIAGRLRWKERGAKLPGRVGLAALDFGSGTLVVTEAGSKKRASLRCVRGAEALARHDPGGLEVLQADLDAFAAAVRSANHTLKRALTDPRILSGIGNAYSDEILHRARLSPFVRSAGLDRARIGALYEAARSVLVEWRDRLIAETGDAFPDKVTAFRPGMAVHGRWREPCPDCGSPVQRIAYAESEANYCARCQTGGRLLADRALSRLLKDDWPETLDELEASDPRREPAPDA